MKNLKRSMAAVLVACILLINVFNVAFSLSQKPEVVRFELNELLSKRVASEDNAVLRVREQAVIARNFNWLL